MLLKHNVVITVNTIYQKIENITITNDDIDSVNALENFTTLCTIQSKHSFKEYITYPTFDHSHCPSLEMSSYCIAKLLSTSNHIDKIITRMEK